jgi:hypothetical protein
VLVLKNKRKCSAPFYKEDIEEAVFNVQSREDLTNKRIRNTMVSL